MSKIKKFFTKIKEIFTSLFESRGFKKVLDILGKIFGSPIFLNSFLAILVGVIVGYIVMFATARNMFTNEWDPSLAWNGLMQLLTGGSKSLQYFGNVLFKAAPLILVGLSVGFAFKTGLFNIGASGQFMVGGIAALYVANLVTMPAPLHFVFAVLAGIIAGALWGFVPGLLKAQFNVNEVITTIMMNYIAMYTTLILAYDSKVYDSSLTAVSAVFPTAHIPRLGLGELFPRSNIDISIIIAILVAVLIWFILRKTTLGYQLKAVGHSTEGARYAGINYKKNVIISMMIAGGLAGFAAAMNYLPLKPDYFRPVEQINLVGFEGISIALIAQSNPLGIIFSGILISYIKQGALSMQLFGFDKQITNIVVSVIIYMIAISAYLGQLIQTKRERARQLKAELKEGENDV